MNHGRKDRNSKGVGEATASLLKLFSGWLSDGPSSLEFLAVNRRAKGRGLRIIYRRRARLGIDQHPQELADHG